MRKDLGIDIVATGGFYDGNLGVFAGLEVVETMDEAGVTARHSTAVGFYTNEEGACFSPNFPTAMIFVPSKGGIGHNVREYAASEEIRTGVDVLLQVMLSVAES